MKIVNCELKEFISYIEQENFEVICFGVAEMAKEALAISVIKNRVCFFVDNNKEKQDKKFILGNSKILVKSPEMLKQEDMSQKVILITSSYFKEIKKQLEQMKELEEVLCYIYPIIRLNYSIDSHEFFEQRIVAECLKEYEVVLENSGIIGKEKKRLLEGKEAYIKGQSRNGERPVVLPRIMIMPTTRCNMRCKDCSSLLPYFDKAMDLSIEQIVKDLEVFFNAIDECIRITVGGEPFLYPELQSLLKYLIAQEKVLGVLLITNSTITPKMEVIRLLKNPKIFVQISDYGHLEKMSRIVVLFESNQVRFKTLTNQTWVDMGDTSFRNRGIEELRYTYLNCDQGRVIKSIHNGRFYICGRSARMHSLGSYECESDYIELAEVDSPKELRGKIKEIYCRESAEACNHCDCGAFPSKSIPAGIQLNDFFSKSGYTIVKRQEYEQLKLQAEIKDE